MKVNKDLLVLLFLFFFCGCVIATSSSKKNRFNTKLPPFGSSVIEHYESCGELRDSIKAALEIDFDKTIEEELKSSFCRDRGNNGGGNDGGDGGDRRLSGGCGAGGGNGGNGGRGGLGGDGGGLGESSFETNNQVEGVDEADVVKSDGTFVFSTYGVEVVMMNLMGDAVDRVTVFPETKDPPRVAGLLLDPVAKTITAISTKYNYRTSEYSSAAHVYSYKDGGLKLGDVVDFPGGYVSARSIGSKAHIISSIRLRYQPRFRRCDATYNYLSDELYEELAFTIAKTVLPVIVERIMADIGAQGGDNACGNIARITSMTDADNDSTENEEDRALDLTNGRGLLQSFVRVTSFDLSVGAKSLVVESAGAFIPTNDIELFSSKEFIVIAGRGYRRTRGQGRFNNYEEYTFLMGFKFQEKNCKVIPSAVGTVKGYLLNQFSMDFFDGILRVATTSFERWEYVGRKWRRVSQSSSQVSKLEFGDDGRMNLVGQLDKLGVRERIFSVRFVRDRGYVVTFRQIDPLFVIDLVPDTPKVLGELKIPGFSNFLQPIGEEEQYLLGIGRQRSRLKISLFDVSDPANPLEAQNRLVRGYSEANFDFKAIRYLPISKKLILPVEVYRFRSRNNFDGFILFDVDAENGIVAAGNVTHADRDRINNRKRYCYSNARLTPRSLVFDGNLVTLKGHSVKYSRGLEALESDWVLNLDKDRDRRNERCYGYF